MTNGHLVSTRFFCHPSNVSRCHTVVVNGIDDEPNLPLQFGPSWKRATIFCSRTGVSILSRRMRRYQVYILFLLVVLVMQIRTCQDTWQLWLKATLVCRSAVSQVIKGLAIGTLTSTCHGLPRQNMTHGQRDKCHLKDLKGYSKGYFTSEYFPANRACYINGTFIIDVTAAKTARMRSKHQN